jgi:hypothetical protein
MPSTQNRVGTHAPSGSCSYGEPKRSVACCQQIRKTASRQTSARSESSRVISATLASRARSRAAIRTSSCRWKRRRTGRAAAPSRALRAGASHASTSRRKPWATRGNRSASVSRSRGSQARLQASHSPSTCDPLNNAASTRAASGEAAFNSAPAPASTRRAWNCRARGGSAAAVRASGQTLDCTASLDAAGVPRQTKSGPGAQAHGARGASPGWRQEAGVGADGRQRLRPAAVGRGRETALTSSAAWRGATHVAAGSPTNGGCPGYRVAAAPAIDTLAGADRLPGVAGVAQW